MVSLEPIAYREEPRAEKALDAQPDLGQFSMVFIDQSRLWASDPPSYGKFSMVFIDQSPPWANLAW